MMSSWFVWFILIEAWWSLYKLVNSLIVASDNGFKFAPVTREVIIWTIIDPSMTLDSLEQT